MLVTSSIAPDFALFLCSCLAVVPSSRPARADAPRARAVKAGHRAVLASCATTARLRLDSPEHGARIRQVGTPSPPSRSEEHTSELQSPIDISYAVFCLKKKKKKNKKKKNNFKYKKKKKIKKK